jgi:hypothetical protein
MGKSLPISALITGLLAGSALGVPPVVARPQTSEVVVEAFPPAMPVEVEKEMERLARGEALDAFGMQGLRRKLARDMQAKLSKIRPAGGSVWDATVPVQLVQVPGSTGGEPTNIVLPAGHTERAAFLGVATAPPPALVRSQLNLPRGMGLVVETVNKDSPAAAAGVQVNDILQKFDDQVLVNVQQLAVLVRSKKAGDDVKLTLLRGGKPMTLTAKLVENDVPLLEDLQAPRLTAGAIPDTTPVPAEETLTRRMIDSQNDITFSRDARGKETLLVKDRDGRTLFQGAPEKAELDAELMKKIHAVQGQPDPAKTQAGTPAAGAKSERSIQVARQDDKYKININSEGAGFHVIARDLAGRQVFEGNADSDADFKAMPADLAERVKAMLEKVK